MRVAVTGARGFVGRYLVEYLREMGDQVSTIDRAGPDPVDVLDPASVERSMSQVTPEAVIHLAALSHVGESWKDPITTFRVNAEGTLNVLRAAGHAGAARVVVVGSAEEYGVVTPDQIPITEAAELRPVTPYGAAKVAAEFLALQHFLAGEVDTVRVRAFNHTGPGQPDRFVVPALATRIAAAEREGDAEVRVGALDAVRDITDVRDVVRAYRLLAVRGVPGEAYNVCSGHGVSVEEVAATLIASAGRTVRLVIDPALVRPTEIPVLVGDNTKLRHDTGWAPEIPLEQTLADVLASVRA